MNKHRFGHYQIKSKWPKRVRFVVILLAALGLGFLFLSWTTPTIEPRLAEAKTEDAEPLKPLPWPAYGQSAVGAVGYGVLATNTPDQQPVPIASLAKVMTALAILEKHPLEPGQPGPSISITYEDVESFNNYQYQNGSVARVVEGQQLSLYQALQAMLISSANNIADTTAVWAFGSMEEYVNFANSYAKELGMDKSHFADASGWSPQTLGTAEDLVKLGDKAMQNPVIAEIVSQWMVTIPEAGELFNTNVFLDFEGNNVVGIKTGYTDEAGGTYLSAARYTIAQGQEITVVAANLGSPSHFQIQQDTMPLLVATRDNFKVKPVVSKGQLVGEYEVPWGGKVGAVASEDIYAAVWGDKVLLPEVKLDPLKAPLASSSPIGLVSQGQDKPAVPVGLDAPLAAPPVTWRLMYGIKNVFN